MPAAIHTLVHVHVRVHVYMTYMSDLIITVTFKCGHNRDTSKDELKNVLFNYRATLKFLELMCSRVCGVLCIYLNHNEHSINVNYLIANQYELF